MGNEYQPLEALSFAKSNDLVSAKYKSSLLENQIMAIALTRIESNVKDNKQVLEAKLYPFELKRLIGDPSHIYRTLKVLSKRMVGHNIFIETPNGGFKTHAIVTDAEYEDQVFTIRFNENLRNHILNLESNYTTFELSVLTNFNSNGSFRIYELLKREFYRSDPKINNGMVSVEYDLSEFRFMIGLANSDNQTVINAASTMNKNIDWNVLYQKLEKKERKYDTWAELRRNVLLPAQVELAEKSNIRFEFEGIKIGYSFKKIRFYIYPNKPKNEDTLKARERIIYENSKKASEQLEYPEIQYKELYAELVDHNGLTDADVLTLLKEAKFDEETVRCAVKMADSQSHIENYMGWMISCIRKGYANPIEIMDGSSEKAQVVNDISKSANDVGETVWISITQKEEFANFLNDVGLTLEMIDIAYEGNAKEKVQLFTDWRIKKLKEQMN